MNLIRWILCIPAAVAASLIVWLIEGKIFQGAHFTMGGGFWYSAIGLGPAVILSALSPLVFVLVGAIVSPRRARPVCLAFFALAPFFSVAGLPLLSAQSVFPLWAADVVGILAGALIGLMISLRVHRPKMPIQPPQTTTGSSAPSRV